MNERLESRIHWAGELLLDAMLRLGDCTETRELQAVHRRLLAQRTPQEHQEMARKMGLPAKVA